MKHEMQCGDIVKLKDDWHMYGYGIVINADHSRYCWVLFMNTVTPCFNGKKWCDNSKLEVISEVGS